jgi:hypothetical protein
LVGRVAQIESQEVVNTLTEPTPRNRLILRKQIVFQLVKKILLIWSPKFHYYVHVNTQLVPNAARLTHSSSLHSAYLRPISIFFHLRLGLPSCLLPSGFQPILCKNLSSILGMTIKFANWSSATYLIAKYHCGRLQSTHLGKLCTDVSA